MNHCNLRGICFGIERRRSLSRREIDALARGCLMENNGRRAYLHRGREFCQFVDTSVEIFVGVVLSYFNLAVASFLRREGSHSS